LKKNDGEKMYATSADWSFDKLPSNFGDKNSEFTNELKGMGALNFFWVQTSKTSGRSITMLARSGNRASCSVPY
tara:strand:- start:143 stop:364 length:222 start_codon:yes stop_codon:yes gene_type:complete